MITFQLDSIPPKAANQGPQTPIERLRIAARHLDREMENQRKSVTAFKQNMSKLDKQMQILSKSCRKFSDALAGVNVSGLHRKSRRLSKILERC